jgi:hypothetical protein
MNSLTRITPFVMLKAEVNGAAHAQRVLASRL